ncbi:MAG: hypothetical protein M3468_00650 [Acidobacteriota bacterium]|nr:hypothetical protein [Acidobacteriota bacterium]
MSAASSRSRRLTAIVAAFAVALLGLLPAEHVHAPEERGVGESVTHRHVVETHSTAAGAILDHDDHAGVRVLSSAVATNTKLAPQQPIVVTVVIVPAPDIKGRQPSMRSGLLPIHSPPPLRLPARAPPTHA